MNLTISHCFLSVHDPEAALAFYRDLLGFTVVADVGYEGMRWITVVSPAQPDLQLVLEPPAPDPGISDSDRQALTELLAKGLLARLILHTEDVDATFTKLEAAGAEVVQEPMDMPYGVRDCAFRDPSGNLIRISRAKTA